MAAKLSEIDEHRYQTIKVLDTNDGVLEFIKGIIDKRGGWTRFCSGAVLLCMIMIVVLLLMNGFSAMSFFHLCIGVLTVLVLIPIHEGIHGLAYYILGARDIRFMAQLKKLLFTAQAHRFVVGYKEFAFVALAPFVMISLSVIVLGIFEIVDWFFVMGVLIMHTQACVGDFAILQFMTDYKNDKVITYDDCEAHLAYFKIENDDFSE